MLVAITGPAGAGKSKLSARLVSAHGFREVSFAEPLKRICKDLFGFSDYELYGPSQARFEPHPTMVRPDGSPLTARYALQKLGTDFARDCCESVWVDYAMRKARELGGNVCFPDTRFKNELAAIRAAGGIVIRRKLDIPLTDMHPTERDLADLPDSDFDHVVGRFDTIDQLHAEVDRLVSIWKAEGL